MKDNTKGYYEQLVGATITGYEEIDDEGVMALDPFPSFTMTTKEGAKLRVEVSRDPEGNGGGFLFIMNATEES